jgi:hypothetical protein
MMEADDAKHYEHLRKLGVNLVKMSAEDRQQIQTIGSAVAKEWADQLDRRGKAGTEVLRAFEGGTK